MGMKNEVIGMKMLVWGIIRINCDGSQFLSWQVIVN